MNQINVLLCGAAGKMGREITRAIAGVPDLELVGAVDLIRVGEDAGLLAGIRPLGITVSDSLPEMLARKKAHVLADFTSPLAVMENIKLALQHRVPAVVGTTGLGDDELQSIRQWVEQYATGAIIAPNFALGAVLMMKMVQLCARYFTAVEIIEMHHDEKLDAPSGTALQTARLIGDSIGAVMQEREKFEKIPGARGGRVSGIPVHSVRLPGLVAHQEVIFGGAGQLLTLRHDAFTRECFIPGLLLAIRRAPRNEKFIFGIENLLD
jgi:4-hydroxy-tetrahydrodipicolinate reductase